jgi:hypothetical protein
VFAVGAVLTIAFYLCCLPETARKSLEEIQTDLINGTTNHRENSNLPS